MFVDKGEVGKVQLETRFGTIAVEEDQIINFPRGILGFGDYHRYVLVERENSSFCLLQSVDEPGLSFVVIMPELVRADYEVELSDEEIELLQIGSPEDGRVFGIVTIPENVAEMTVNLQAPVVINTKDKLGAQLIISGDKYHTKHNVLAEMHKNAYLLQQKSKEQQSAEEVPESV
ncbi:MAG TPA: flagellar assembly protein FliW [Firmicutes bacterium]|jgi:flagellar assembly factor FliW|nr:flagellar assembly protein FliW [Bacillota bacterium]